jgi:hypothetical protein
MHQAIKVDSRFATPYDTARILGVSRSRTEDLIRRVRRLTDGVVKKSNTGEQAATGPRKRIATSLAKKNSGRNAVSSAKKTKTKAKSAKAHG